MSDRAWERVSQKYKEDDEVGGVVLRKIKGGLLVDVEGVNVFLPASQVNLRRTHDISDFIDEPIRARIIKIDPERMNIVISRRKLLEEERQRLKENLREEIEENCDYVGDEFAEEAKRIHFGESEERGIYGEATEEEADELDDEGVEFFRFPSTRRRND